ncbi:MAG: hypothetical protein ACI8Y9_000295 [Paracoccaceae bacterium]|jgi:hypothetical protein
MKYFTFTSCILLFTLAVALNAEETEVGETLLTGVTKVASGADLGTTALDLAASAALAKLNSEADVLQEKMTNGNFMYLDFKIGRDNKKTVGELMSVYRLRESQNWGIFNQTSIVRYDYRTTLNIGLGARHINNAETVIFGLNAFIDKELQRNHSRASVGTEFVTSLGGIRANYYEALSNNVLYKNRNEQALDGYDVKINYELPFFLDSDLYYKSSEWKNGRSNDSYKTSTSEVGVSAEIQPNLILSIGSQKTDTSARETVGSVSYSIPLGGVTKKTRKRRTLSFKTDLQPIREQLFKPVDRENRIKKKQVGLVIVSGF